ncbi:MAG: hypothetical protein RL681_769, partial [Candidatus Parcubacteria bacterium]
RIFQGKVSRVEAVARGVKKITFAFGEPFAFLPWQYVWVEIPTMKIDDSKGNRRAFSILNTINNDNTIEIVARIGESGYKQSLFALEVNDTVTIHGPFGHSFIIDETSNKNIIMIAGGVGIAAFLPMLYTIHERSFPLKCFLLYLNNDEEGTPFAKELEDLKKTSNWFDYRISYQRFVFNDVGSVRAGLGEDVRWWITGPQSMVDLVYGELERGGISRVNMEFENFYPSRATDINLASIRKNLEDGNIFSQALQNSTNHTIITNSNGVVLYANKAAERITGYSHEEIVGNTPRLWGGMMSREFYAEFWNKKISKEPFSGPIINRRKNGELYYAIAHIAPILGAQGELIGFIGTEEDITLLKMQEAKVQESEQRLKLALEGNRDGLWDWNIVTDQVYFSPRWKEMLGFGDDEIQGNVTEWEKRVHPDDLKRVQDILAAHLEGRTDFYESEHRMLCKDGSFKWILDRGRVIERDGAGKALRATGTHTDISERKAIQEALEALTKKFQLATRSAEIGVWEWDIASNALSWDDQMYALYGIKAQDRMTMTYDAWREAVHPDDREAAEQDIKLAVSGEKEFNTIFRIVWPNGETRYLRAFGYVERYVTGVPIKMFGVNFDITREMNLEQERKDFISLASHQLRTPLTGIRWVVERFIKTEPLSDKGKEYMNDIHASATRLSNLMENLLDASRVDSGGVEIKPQDLEAISFVTDLVKEYGPMCDEKKIRLVFKDHPDSLNMKTDHSAFKNIIQSLVDNAISYTPEDGTVEISIGRDGSSFAANVSDTGIGIPKAEHNKIFEKFARASNAKLYKSDGTGLGLYIAAKATTLLNGKIWFESEENKGTTFHVRLPIAADEKKGEKSFPQRVV